MRDSCISLRCGACGSRFSVDLGSMRLNLSHVCPCCGFEHSISAEQALKAHRTLERLERKEKSAGRGQVRLALLRPWTLAEGSPE